MSSSRPILRAVRQKKITPDSKFVEYKPRSYECHGFESNCVVGTNSHSPGRNTKELVMENFKFKLQISKTSSDFQKVKLIVSCNEEMYNNLWECKAQLSLDNFSPEKVVFNCYNNSMEETYEIEGNPTNLNVNIKIVRICGSVQKFAFDFGEPGFSDVTFLIEGKKVYAHRSILSVNSPYFSSMFLSNFAGKNMEEIVLEETVLEEFVELLKAIYPTNHKVDGKNFESLLRLADMYQLDCILRKCESFIESSSGITLIHKLQYAEEYGLLNLEKSCFETFKTANDVSHQLSCYGKHKLQNLNTVSESMQTKILEHWAKLTIPNCKASFVNASEKTTKEKETIEKLLEDWKDTVLKIEGVDVLVNRAYLSIYSPYFQQLLFEKRDEAFVEIRNVKCDAFLEFLSYIYQPDLNLEVANIDNLLLFAYHFQVSSLVLRCEEYLMNLVPALVDVGSYKAMHVPFLISEAYQLSNLQEVALKSLAQKSSKIQSIIGSHEFNKLGPKSRLALLRCCFLSHS